MPPSTVGHRPLISILRIVMERHHALNWLIGYIDADDVTTDT
jgi:hypothetical protein